MVMPLSTPTNLQAALYDESLPDGRVRCTLCPHGCTIAPGHRGACGVRVNRQGTLFTLMGNRIVSAELDPIEKKPLFHCLPGSHACSIACQVRDESDHTPRGPAQANRTVRL